MLAGQEVLEIFPYFSSNLSKKDSNTADAIPDKPAKLFSCNIYNYLSLNDIVKSMTQFSVMSDYGSRYSCKCS